MWAFSAFFDAPRVGLHTYRKGDRIYGYYESGERSQRLRTEGQLLWQKNWFSLKMKEKKGKTLLDGHICYSPMTVLVELAVIFGLFAADLLLMLQTGEPLTLIACLVIVAIFIPDWVKHYKQQKTVESILRKIIMQ